MGIGRLWLASAKKIAMQTTIAPQKPRLSSEFNPSSIHEGMIIAV
jgi:hypothetical protein